MTTLEYMQRQLEKHRLNYERESARGVPDEQLRNIKRKIQHYEEAVAALEKIKNRCEATDKATD
jgi:hypothetical protein